MFINLFFFFVIYRDESSHVTLKFLEQERRVREVIYGREYKIRAEVAQPNGTYGIRVKNCFAFSKKNISFPLIDDRGCAAQPTIMTRFTTTSDGTQANAVLYSMFKFPEGSEVHIQCDIVQCNKACSEVIDCNGNTAVKADRTIGQSEDGLLIASTTVFVLDPANAPSIYNIIQ